MKGERKHSVDYVNPVGHFLFVGLFMFLIISLTSCIGGAGDDSTQSPGSSVSDSDFSESPLFEKDGSVASFEKIDPRIRKVVIDDDPNSPIAARLIFQPDDHGIESVDIFGPKIDEGQPADYAVVNLVNSDESVVVDLDENGRLSTISTSDVQMSFEFSGDQVNIKLNSEGEIIESGLFSLLSSTDGDGGVGHDQDDSANDDDSDIIVIDDSVDANDDVDSGTDDGDGVIDLVVVELKASLAAWPRATTGQNNAIIEWRDENCTYSEFEILDRAEVCIYIKVPHLAGRTIRVFVYEDDIISNDYIGNELNITLDEQGVATIQYVAMWREDEGWLGGDPEYRFEFLDNVFVQTFRSPKLYVTRSAVVDMLEVNRGVAVDILVQTTGGDLPADFIFDPVVHADCWREDTVSYSCRTWKTPQYGNTITVGIVHTATDERAPGSEPYARLDPEICDTWESALQNDALPWLGGFAGTTVFPGVVDLLLSNSTSTLLNASGVGAATSLGSSTPHVIITGLVAIGAYGLGNMAGTQLDNDQLDCEALIERASDLAKLTNDLQSIKFDPIKVCMANVPDWKWEQQCQETAGSYTPFDPTRPLGTLGQLTFLLGPDEEVPAPANETITVVGYRNFDGESDSTLEDGSFTPSASDMSISGSLSDLKIYWSGGAINGGWLGKVYDGFGLEQVLYFINQKIISNPVNGNVDANIILSPLTYGDYDVPSAGPAHSNIDPQSPPLEYDQYYEARISRSTLPPEPDYECQQGECSDWAKIIFIVNQ